MTSAHPGLGRHKRVGDHPAAGIAEDELASSLALDRVGGLVKEAMVVTAEEDQVVELGLAAMGPVLDVVGVEPAPVVAAREATAPVAKLEGAADCRGHGSRLSADREHLSRTRG